MYGKDLGEKTRGVLRWRGPLLGSAIDPIVHRASESVMAVLALAVVACVVAVPDANARPHANVNARITSFTPFPLPAHPKFGTTQVTITGKVSSCSASKKGCGLYPPGLYPPLSSPRRYRGCDRNRTIIVGVATQMTLTEVYTPSTTVTTDASGYFSGALQYSIPKPTNNFESYASAQWPEVGRNYRRGKVICQPGQVGNVTVPNLVQ